MCTVGIWGMGDIGKTTIAEVVFNRISEQFEGRCLRNVREELERCGSLVHFKNEILSEVIEKEICSRTTPARTRNKYISKEKKFSLFFSHQHQQLMKCVGQDVLLFPESRIILTHNTFFFLFEFYTYMYHFTKE